MYSDSIKESQPPTGSWLPASGSQLLAAAAPALPHFAFFFLGPTRFCGLNDLYECVTLRSAIFESERTNGKEIY